MTKTMTCAVLYGVGDVRLEQRPVPTPGPGEVLVRIKRVGICGSDIHYFTHGRIGDFVVRDPMILGHESAGEVAVVGEGVTRF
ncbi:MAG: alcohol dehydrogenase catalytic domain-containing protein, partial [Anaerolineae bacterium]